LVKPMVKNFTRQIFC